MFSIVFLLIKFMFTLLIVLFTLLIVLFTLLIVLFTLLIVLFTLLIVLFSLLIVFFRFHVLHLDHLTNRFALRFLEILSPFQTHLILFQKQLKNFFFSHFFCI